MAADHTTAIFAAELILLLFFGRMLGEVMSRVGQPAIFGQLLAGVVLGPSVFGALMPELRQIIFPGTPALKSMIDAVSQIGILLLLLLTGMETNLSLVNRKRRAVISTSFFGIAVPFVCGVLLTYALPKELIPSPEAPLVRRSQPTRRSPWRRQTAPCRWPSRTATAPRRHQPRDRAQ